jgi:regulation of enolase protein 1 (concanavalin A-like superfamily)
MFLSDDFSGLALEPRWERQGPVGTVSLAAAAGEAYVALAVPSGNYQPWQGNNALRLMQAAANTDFGIEARFLSTPTQKHQMQGLLVEQDASNWIRFDTHHNGTSQRIYAAVTIGGVSTSRFNKAIAAGSAEHLRLEREGDLWVFKYSADGQNWTTAGSFSHGMTVTKAGPFAGTTSPAFTALVDYVFDTANPILNEDAGVAANRPPNAQDDVATTSAGAPLLLQIGDLLANDSDPDGDPLQFTGFTQPANGSLVNNNNGSLTYTPATGFSGTDSFTYTVSDGQAQDTATVRVSVQGQTPPPPATFLSDDFSGLALEPRWERQGPVGTVSLAAAAGEAYVALAVPSGNYQPWQGNNALRLMQAAANTDFGIEARFLSTPTQKHQMQGLLVEQDASNWIRFDTHHNGTSQRIYAAVTIGGVSTSRFNKAIAAGSAEHLRLEREGDLWVFKYSADGQNWTTAGSFSHGMTVTKAGPFAGTTSPAFTALVDYVFDTANPILNEDAGVAANRPPNAQDDVATTSAGAPLLLQIGDLLANDSDPDGDPLQFTGFTQPANGSLVNNNNGSLTYTPATGFSGTDSFTYTVSDGQAQDTATVRVSVQGGGGGSIINVWYGGQQTFGEPGEGQRWINILGNVPRSEVSSLSYSLNGGPDRSLKIGPDGRRLQSSGDFNIDIDFRELNGGAANDVVRIKARLTSGQTVTQDVTIKYASGNDWPSNYDVKWNEVLKLTDVVQVVDGLWSHNANGARPVIQGYDRLLVLGDENWDNFEATFKMTTHDLTSFNTLTNPGFGLGMHWGGHTPGLRSQPHSYYKPGAAFFYKDNGGAPTWKLHEYYDFKKVKGGFYNLQNGGEYNIKIAVGQVNVMDRTYKLKIWEDGSAEPTNWLIQHTQPFSEPVTGSVYIALHYVDVTVGDVKVREIPGNDILKGTEGPDILIGVNAQHSSPGRGEIDVLVGKGGNDLFVLGGGGRVYYDDGNSSSPGHGDYALIWDFTKGQDKVQLSGTIADYIFSNVGGSLPTGAGIYHVNSSGPNELIGIIRGLSASSISQQDLIFTGPDPSLTV